MRQHELPLPPRGNYAASFQLDARAWSLWLLSSIFFLGPIFYVKMAALQHRAVADKSALPALAAMRARALAYHGLSLVAVVLWAASGGVPALAAIPFAASLVKTFLRGSRPPERVDFKELGYAEVGYSVLFVVLMGLAFAARAAA